MPALQAEEMGMTISEKEEVKRHKKMKAASEERDRDAGTASGDEKKKKKRKKREGEEVPTNGNASKSRRGDDSAEDGEAVKRWRMDDAAGVQKGDDDDSLEEGEAKRWKDDDISEEEVVDPLAITNFRLSKAIKETLEKKGIKTLFPIQAQTFDIVLDGSDIVGRARTGQGKTLAFVLPIIESLLLSNKDTHGQRKIPSVIVLAPTRELAKQVHADFELFAKAVRLSTVCVYGGASYGPQCDALRRGVDIVVGTPGRIKDHLNRGSLNLTKLKFRVLDEADEMLNMGFVEDVETILGAGVDAANVQTLLFSATMPKWVQQIASRFLKPGRKTVDLVENQILKASSTVRHLLLQCSSAQVENIVGDVIQCYSSEQGRAIVFTETKNAATELVARLHNVSARALHGDIMQAQREVTLAGFRSGKFKVLVATDVAARGLDITDVELVIQLEAPRDVESYIHRSGRTGRANKTGISVLLCDPRRRSRVMMIERAAGVKFERITAPSPADLAQVSTAAALEAVNAVSERAVPFFREAATSLIDSLGAVEAMARALAKIAGHSDALSRSMLTSLENGVTLHFHSENEMYTPAYVWTFLKRVLSEELVNEARGMALTADRRGAVFDVPSKLVDKFTSVVDTQGRGSVYIDVAESIPDLYDREGSGGGRGGGRFGGARRFGGGGGGSRWGGGGGGGGGGRWSGAGGRSNYSNSRRN